MHLNYTSHSGKKDFCTKCHHLCDRCTRRKFSLAHGRLIKGHKIKFYRFDFAIKTLKLSGK